MKKALIISTIISIILLIAGASKATSHWYPEHGYIMLAIGFLASPIIVYPIVCMEQIRRSNNDIRDLLKKQALEKPSENVEPDPENLRRLEQTRNQSKQHPPRNLTKI